MPKKGFNFTKLKQNVAKTQPVKANGAGDGDIPKAAGTTKQLTLSKFFFSAKSASEKSFDQLVKDKTHLVQTSSEKRNSSSSDDVFLESKKQKLDDEFDLSQAVVNQDGKSMHVADGTMQKLRTYSCNSGECVASDSPRKILKPSSRKILNNFQEAEDASPCIEESDDVEEDEEGGHVALVPKASSGKGVRGKEKRESSSGACKYTPLEQQFMEIKKKHEDAILFIECGYRYRFFGKDAEIAAKELNIVCHPDHNFDTASIPTHRLFVHARRLVSKGYKVGVVKQTETAALKAAGDNRSGPFARELSALYTKSTIIGEDMDPVCGPNEITSEFSSGPACTSYLLCFCEAKSSEKGRVIFGLVALQPSTGNLIYDAFSDIAVRAELDTRLAHIQPVEMLIPKTLTSNTELLIKNVVCSSSTIDDRMRVERLDDSVFEYSSALCVVTAFYDGNLPNDDDKHTRMQTVLNLPVEVICCLAGLVTYLRDFKLDKVLVSAGYKFSKFTTESTFMNLNAVTLHNLEIFQNTTDGKNKCTLHGVLDRCSTKFGSRLLRKWISQPLRDLNKIEERQDMITEILGSSSTVFGILRDLLAKLPDLEKGLGSIFHLKCSTSVFYSVAKSLCKVKHTLLELEYLISSEIKSKLLRELMLKILSCLKGIDHFSDNINEGAAKEGDKTKIFVDVSEFPSVVLRRQNILEVRDKLKSLKSSIRQILRVPGFDYSSVSGQEFLIEVRNAQLKAVPKEWIKISSTKQVVRFRSPEVEKLVQKLTQLREQLQIDCAEAWNSYLFKFNEHFHQYSKAVNGLAQLDCCLSLVKVAQQPNFCRPFFMQHSSIIQIEGGWHPVLGIQHHEQQYVTNETALDACKKSCMIITGPNMGGKSSYIRQVALIVLMAQIGSYVPAEAATLGIFDGIYTRMGATDEIFHGRSTFMVELTETAEIMRQATSQSLVILDELGRGTSTHDGVAIAHAVLHCFLKEVSCLTMFVTHYTTLTEMEQLFPDNIANYHMGFLVDESDSQSSDSTELVTFLYRLTPGVASRSYGLNVAQLAAIPEPILCVATHKSKEMEKEFLQHKLKLDVLKKLWPLQNMNLLIEHQLELKLTA